MIDGLDIKVGDRVRPGDELWAEMRALRITRRRTTTARPRVRGGHVTLTETWRAYRRELDRLLNEGANPHRSVAECEQEALRLALAESGVELAS